MSLSTNNRELPSYRMLAVQTYAMSIIVAIFMISLCLRVTSYLLPESVERTCIIFLLVLDLLRDGSAIVGKVANVGVGPTCLRGLLSAAHQEGLRTNRKRDSEMSGTPFFDGPRDSAPTRTTIRESWTCGEKGSEGTAITDQKPTSQLTISDSV